MGGKSILRNSGHVARTKEVVMVQPTLYHVPLIEKFRSADINIHNTYQPSRPWKPRRPPAIKTLFFRAGVSFPLLWRNIAIT